MKSDIENQSMQRKPAPGPCFPSIEVAMAIIVRSQQLTTQAHWLAVIRQLY
jgi:hypothetical protein